jgi:hypothetical protein
MEVTCILFLEQQYDFLDRTVIVQQSEETGMHNKDP